MATISAARYVQFYVDGTAARNLELSTPAETKKKSRPVRANKKKVHCLYVDPVATFGIVVAVFMLVLMLCGVNQLNQAKQAASEMGYYVSTLHYENVNLSEEYAAGYNLDDIEQKALALGMVPSEQARVTVIDISVPEAEQEAPTLWEQATVLLTRLFA